MEQNDSNPSDPAVAIDHLDREDLVKLVKSMLSNGVALTFHGKRTAVEIARRVRPRVTRREPKLHVGEPADQAKNLLVEGENLQAMVTLYKYRGQVDLIVTDPPYNTGQQFRYNDKWDTDPNDPNLGTLVAKDDGSRHTKWIKAMMPRLQMMKSMLKPSGIIAVCIDDNELFHLGMLMDEVFGEENRIGIINWQKTYSPKKTNHLSTATEYVLVYARDASLGKTGLLPRDDAMDARYDNTDLDPEGGWRGGDATAPQHRTTTSFAVQSPYTGVLHYPEGEYASLPVAPKSSHHWRLSRAEIRASLQATGVKYEERDLGDRRGPALVIKGSKVALKGYNPAEDAAVTKAIESSVATRKTKPWPLFFFNDSKNGKIGGGRPSVKRYIDKVVKGRIPWTYWADEEYESAELLGAQSWDHADSGHSQAGLNELDAIVGKGHGFQTVKPLRLIKKIIQLWCPPSGLVFDPYGGSGTTGHAVLELNNDTGSDRRFILVEQGSPERGDKYARSLTWLRLKNAVTGERPDGKGKFTVKADPLGGGFEFRMLTRQIDAKTVLSMKKDELIDVVITSHWEPNRRGSPNLIRVDDPRYLYLVGMNEQNEGYFIIWDNGGPVGQLDRETYRSVLKDAEKAGISPPYNVYARYEVYQSRNVRFWKIPDKILSHLGLNESSDRYNEEDEAN